MADIKLSDTTELAYIGDACFSLLVRQQVLSVHKGKIDQINRIVTKFVKAEGQAAAVRRMMADGFLTEEEEGLVKRARNHTNTNHPRSAGPVTYKMATGLEALVGYHYLAGNGERLDEIVKKAMEIVEEQEA